MKIILESTQCPDVEIDEMELPHVQRQLALLTKTVGDWDRVWTDIWSHMQAGHVSLGDLRRAAWLAAVRGGFLQAEGILRYSAQLPDDRGNADYAIAALRAARGDAEGARTCVIEAVRRAGLPDAHQIKIARTLAANPQNRPLFSAVFDICGYAHPFYQEFDCFSIPFVIREEEKLTYCRVMERAYGHLGSMSEAVRAAIDYDHELNGQSYWYHVNMGHYCWLNRMRGDTDYHYLEARRLALRDGIFPIHYNCGIFTWLPIKTVEAISTRTPSDRFHLDRWIWSHVNLDTAQPRFVIALGCDTKYFRFFPKFLMSAVIASHKAREAGSLLIHVSVANPTQEQLAFLHRAAQELEQTCTSVRVSFCYGKMIDADVGLFTCIRFLFLGKVLERFRADTFVFDIDDLLPEDFFDRVSSVKDADFGFRLHNFEGRTQVRGDPWSINASQVYIAYAQRGVDFARIAANCIVEAHDAKLPTTWTIDQSALGQSFDLVVQDHSDVKVIDLSAGEPLSVMPHTVGGREAMYNLGGTIDLENFFTLFALHCLGSE